MVRDDSDPASLPLDTINSDSDGDSNDGSEQSNGTGYSTYPPLILTKSRQSRRIYGNCQSGAEDIGIGMRRTDPLCGTEQLSQPVPLAFPLERSLWQIPSRRCL